MWIRQTIAEARVLYIYIKSVKICEDRLKVVKLLLFVHWRKGLLKSVLFPQFLNWIWPQAEVVQCTRANVKNAFMQNYATHSGLEWNTCQRTTDGLARQQCPSVYGWKFKCGVFHQFSTSDVGLPISKIWQNVWLATHQIFLEALHGRGKILQNNTGNTHWEMESFSAGNAKKLSKISANALQYLAIIIWYNMTWFMAPCRCKQSDY